MANPPSAYSMKVRPRKEYLKLQQNKKTWEDPVLSQQPWKPHFPSLDTGAWWNLVPLSFYFLINITSHIVFVQWKFFREKPLLWTIFQYICYPLGFFFYKRRQKLGALKKCFLSLFIKYVGFWRSFRFNDYFPNIWEIGCHIPFPIPFPNFGNSISNSRSRSRMSGSVFLIPDPVPEDWEQYF